jgi:competence protein ComEC
VALAAISLAWVAGVFLGSHLNLSPLFLFVTLAPLPLLLFRKLKGTVLLASLCLLALGVGALYYQSVLPPNDDTRISYYNDSGKVTLRGVVSIDPDVQDKTTRLKLSVDSIEVNGERQEVSGMVMLYAPRYPAYSYGDLLEVTGKLETPLNFADFDYQAYLAKQSVYSSMLYPEIKLDSGGHGLALLDWIYGLRHKLADVMARTLPEPQASLAQGIVLGLRGNIPDDVNTDFARSGTTHILAVSGMNLTIIAGLLSLILGRIIGKRFYLYVWLTLALIWFYTLISGASPSVMRAAIMASLFLIAELLGRQKNAGSALCLTAAVMVAFNPMVLWDVSFQLSALSMAGIIFLYPLLLGGVSRWVERIRSIDVGPGSSINFVLEGFAMTLAATLAVWPASASYFGMVSLAAPFATLLAIPVLPAIMALGSLSALAGLLYFPLALVSGWVVWLFVTYLLLVARGFAHLPHAVLTTGNISTALILAYYGLMVLAIWLLARRRRTKLMSEMVLAND